MTIDLRALRDQVRHELETYPISQAHPPEAIGPRYVAAIGGVDRVVEIAQSAFGEGDFRWAATLLDHAIFTDENHAGARQLYADTL